MSDTIIINYPNDEGLTINIDDNDDVIVNIIDEPDIIVNLCDDLGTTANNYDYLDNKPSINNVELVGNKTLDDLGIEPKRGADDFYITSAEKTQGALATGNAVFPTVKQVADRADRLLVDLILPSNIPSLEIVSDKYGNLLSTLNIKSIICCGVLITDISTSAGSERLSINNDNSNTYSSISSSVVGGYRFGIYKLVEFSFEISIINNNAIFNGISYGSQNVGITNLNVLANIPLGGIKTGATKIDSIKFEKYNNNFNFLSGSTIKIYRND